MPNEVLNSPTECDAVLATASVTRIVERLDLKLAWMKIIDQSNYEKFKKDFSASVPGYFDGTYDEFSQKRSALFQQENYELDISSSRDVLMTSVPAAAIEAWSACIAVKHPGLHCWLSQVDRESGVLNIRWSPPAGLGPLRDTELNMIGGSAVADLFSPNDAFLGEVRILLKRDASNQAINGVVSGKAGVDGMWSASFYVPPRPAPVKKEIHFEQNFGPATEISFPTPPWPGPATVRVDVSITSSYETPGNPWLQLSVWLDGVLQHWSGEVGLGGDKTLNFAFNLSIPAGQSRSIKMRHDNYHAKAKSMILKIDGEYVAIE